MYPQEYRYSKEHEWVQTEEDVCTVGITHFAQDELGEVVFVELPARLVSRSTPTTRSAASSR
jgi:glycine cleavage system H lipoate-binding protein